MTRRGRATLASLGVLVGSAASAVAWFAGESPPARAGGEPVPTVTGLAQPPPLRPPPEILERLPVSRRALELPTAAAPGEGRPSVPVAGAKGRLYELIPVSREDSRLRGPLRVEYTLDAELTRQVFRVLERGRVDLGHVILLEPTAGRVLAYASTDVEQFPPTRAYPAASLVKVITAAAALGSDPDKARLPCRYRGSPYRLTRSRIDPPKRGHTVSLRRALATSNNQCFAQLAVHAVGGTPLVEAIERFGWLSEPAVAHAAGTVEIADDRYEVGRLGCGLAGCRITPLHAAQLAATLAHGELITPRWIERVLDGLGRELPAPAVKAPRRVLTRKLAAELRAMLVDTTVSGTARGAFRGRGGRPLLGPVKVAGKTGSLSGSDPRGRYEWFIGAAPAEAPSVAVAVVLVQGDLWWRNASQIAAEVLRSVFCSEGECRPDAVARWTHSREAPSRERARSETAAAG
jgi:cell division protein FtsI/penicillin-binding protein 2